MPRRLLLLVAVLAAIGMISGPPLAGASRATSSAAWKSCGTYRTYLHNGSRREKVTFAYLRVTGLSCRSARHILVQIDTYSPPSVVNEWHGTFPRHNYGGKYPYETTYRNGGREIAYRYNCKGC